ESQELLPISQATEVHFSSSGQSSIQMLHMVPQPAPMSLATKPEPPLVSVVEPVVPSVVPLVLVSVESLEELPSVLDEVVAVRSAFSSETSPQSPAPSSALGPHPAPASAELRAKGGVRLRGAPAWGVRVVKMFIGCSRRLRFSGEGLPRGRGTRGHRGK